MGSVPRLAVVGIYEEGICLPMHRHHDLAKKLTVLFLYNGDALSVLSLRSWMIREVRHGTRLTRG